MFFSENLKRTVYHVARSVNEDGVSVYSEPTEYRVSCYTVLPASAGADLVMVGTSFSDYLRIVGDPEYLAGIKELDKFYVDNPVPSSPDPLAKDADFYVYSIFYSPNCTNMRLRRLVVNDG